MVRTGIDSRYLHLSAKLPNGTLEFTALVALNYFFDSPLLSFPGLTDQFYAESVHPLHVLVLA